MKNKLIVLFSILFYLSIPACSVKNEVEIFGYLYKDEVATLTIDDDTIMKFKMDCKTYSNSTCYFSKKVYYNNKSVSLKVTVDSTNIRVLDTVIKLSSEVKKPFISLIDPSGKKTTKRELFLGDESDSTFFKY